MEESILKSTKKILGLAEDYTAFDQDVITHINASFSILNQLGVGPVESFMINDDVTVWADYDVPDNQLHLVKTYIYLKTRLLFDPRPLLSSLKPQIVKLRNMSGGLIPLENGNSILLIRRQYQKYQ